MGGTIDVESEPGRGTVFTVRVSMRYVERDAKGSLEESDDADALCDVSQGDAPRAEGRRFERRARAACGGQRA